MNGGPLFYDENGDPVWELPCSICGVDTEGYYHRDENGNTICESCWNGYEIHSENSNN